MRMKCSFCKKEIPKGTGKMFVKADGTLFYFCSSKCQNNWKLKRDSKKVNWVRKKQPEEKKSKK
ncbi:MAG: 50S ribosomal protein L24e [Candidatus Micrarchaeota archaeon]|nr:50S ribosomal protein L24e [Candidatus Micrarchaeota archaeon]